MSEEELEKRFKLNELIPYLTNFPMLAKYFDVESEKLIDEKIEVLKMVKEGKNINEIPNFYKIFELLPIGEKWD